MIKDFAMHARFFRFAPLLLLLVTLAYPVRAADSLTHEQKDEVEKIVHDYLMSHPDFMVEVLRSAEAHFKAQKTADGKQAIAKKRDELLHDMTSGVAGNPDGDVTLVEFFDYNCVHCRNSLAAMKTFYAAHKDVRYAFIDFPIFGDDSLLAARAAIAPLPPSPDACVRISK